MEKTFPPTKDISFKKFLIFTNRAYLEILWQARTLRQENKWHFDLLFTSLSHGSPKLFLSHQQNESTSLYKLQSQTM